MPAHTKATESLRRFAEADEAADSLEEFKLAARRGPRVQRLIARCAARCCEERLDLAWGDIGRIAEGVGDVEAGLVAAHYLFGETWEEVAAEANLSKYQAKWRAYEALGWLEQQPREE